MEISKKEIILRLLNQIYSLIDFNKDLKERLKELEDEIKELKKGSN